MFFRKVRWFGNHARLLATAPCVPTTMCISTMAGPHMVVGRPLEMARSPQGGEVSPQEAKFREEGRGEEVNGREGCAWHENTQ